MPKIKILPLPNMTDAFRMIEMQEMMKADLVRVTGIDHAGLGRDRTAYTEIYRDVTLHGDGYMMVKGVSVSHVSRSEVIAKGKCDK